MAYITQDDLVPLRLTLADLAELTSETDDPDPAVVQLSIDKASAVVDGYCGQRYKTPLQPSIIVQSITADLAIYELASRRRDVKMNETWVDRRNTAMKLLTDVANGKASLDQQVAGATPQLSSNDVETSRVGHVFDECNLRGFC